MISAIVEFRKPSLAKITRAAALICSLVRSPFLAGRSLVAREPAPMGCAVFASGSSRCRGRRVFFNARAASLMAGFTANCPDLMKADDVLVPYFVLHPKYFARRCTSDQGCLRRRATWHRPESHSQPCHAATGA